MTSTTSKGPVTARATQAAETRHRLIEAAIDQFSAKHYDEVAVSDIAKSAGVAYGLLFHYFNNKRGIYLEAMREAARNLDVAQNVPTDDPPGQQIRALIAGNFRYLAAHRGLAMRLVLGGRGADPEAWELFEEDRWRAIERVADLLGLDPQVPALRMMLRATVGGVDQAAAYWLHSEDSFPVEPVIEALIELIAAGLRGAALLDPTLEVEAAVELLDRG